MKKNDQTPILLWRFHFIIIVFIIIILILISRMFYLMVLDRDFLLKQGNARSLRTIDIPASRGMILDRRGEPLAVSTPMNSVWIDPQDFPRTKDNNDHLSHTLGISSRSLNKLLINNANKQFVYVRRNINPDVVKEIKQLAIPGVYLEKSYKRYYSTGEVTSQVVGFTNIDEKGVEGLELAFDDWLKGTKGKQQIVKDLYGNTVEVMSIVQEAMPGKDLYLSLDNRIQFLAYRVLKKTVEKYQAKSGSVVVFNPKTGEILAMANQPFYNPNKRPRHGYHRFRNRAVTDVFEPGSTAKIFSIISALKSKKYSPNTLVDTSPGWFKIGNNKVRDVNGINLGVLSVSQVLQKSSNVGVAKIILSLPPENLIDVLYKVGFGRRTDSVFPGENTGVLKDEAFSKPFVLATLAFGYGFSVTPLQLTVAYSTIATGGLKCPVTFLKRINSVNCESVFKPRIAREALKMLELVVSSGTGRLAQVKEYRVAGKTGTAYIAGLHGYEEQRYESSFVGIAPVSDPQLVVTVVIRDPKGKHYGSLVAAPAFGEIMSGSLKILNVEPDKKEIS